MQNTLSAPFTDDKFPSLTDEIWVFVQSHSKNVFIYPSRPASLISVLHYDDRSTRKGKVA